MFELGPVIYVKVPKTKTQMSPKNRIILYGLYIRRKSDQGIEVPYGAINDRSDKPDYQSWHSNLL
jgi:hypothetical protein